MKVESHTLELFLNISLLALFSLFILHSSILSLEESIQILFDLSPELYDAVLTLITIFFVYHGSLENG